MGHVAKYKNQYSDTDYLILNKVAEPLKANDLLNMFHTKHIIELHVYKQQSYNQQCLIVWYTTYKNININYIGIIYLLDKPEERIYKYLDEVYVNALPSAYELAGVLKGITVTKQDVSDFANKVKSIKERLDQHSEVKTYGDSNNYSIAGGKSP
jgi:predicted DNA-binding ArsR family transcriptional regulator